mgnify:CR=1 FL=1
MMDLFLQLSAPLAIVFYAGAILIHILTIRKIIPYDLVNGGRSKSYEYQKKQSASSIVILFVALLFVLFSVIYPEFKKSIIYVILAFTLTAMWFLGTILQFMGTAFERLYLSWLNIAGFISHLGLALLHFVE